MSPPPCRLRHVDVLPPPGMKKVTAPAVHPEGHATALPVDVSMQWLPLAISPRGGVAVAGSMFGRVGSSGMRWPSGGAGWEPAAQELTVTKKFVPVSMQYVRPEQLPFGAMYTLKSCAPGSLPTVT